MTPGATPVGGMGMATPTPSQLAQSTQSGAMTPEQFQVRFFSFFTVSTDVLLCQVVCCWEQHMT